MISIQDGRQELFQWDTGRKLTVPKDCSQVHYSNRPFGAAITVEASNGVADIPDELLQSSNDLYCWAFVGTAEDGYTKIEKKIKVQKKSKPHDYVYTPTQQLTLGEVVERVNKVEKQSQDVIDRIESGELRGEPGPPGPQGPKGEGASFWKDLSDKPFDESVQNLGDTITWDGTPNEDVVVIPDGLQSMTLFRISENTPTIEELQTGRFTVTQGDVVVDINVSELRCEDLIPGITIVASDGFPFLVVVKHDNFHLEQDGFALDVKKKGVYSVYIEDEDTDLTGEVISLFISSLTIPNYNFTKTDIKKLDPKFLPDGGFGYTVKESVKDTLTWDGTPTGVSVIDDVVTCCHVSDSTPSAEELIGGSLGIRVNTESGTIDLTDENISHPGGDVDATIIGNKDGHFAVVIRKIGASVGTSYFPRKGIYFVRVDTDDVTMVITSLTIPGYTFTKEAVHKIDEKYLPDNLPVVELTTPLTISATGQDTLTQAESSALSVANATGKPVVLKGSYEGVSWTTVANNLRGFGLFASMAGNDLVLRRNDNGEWIMFARSNATEEIYAAIGSVQISLDEQIQRIDQNAADVQELKKGGVVPKATASDNGKFLQVVDGAYALVELQDVSEEGL